MKLVQHFKIRFFILYLLFVPAILNAQDTLYIKGQPPVAGKVVEISEDAIRYKKVSNPDGPVYVVKKRSTVRIVYQNGEIDSLHKKTIEPSVVIVKNPEPFKWLKGKYTASVVLSDFLFQMATINIERSFFNDHLAVRIPFSLGFNYEGKDTNYMELDNQAFSLDFLRKGYYSEVKIFSTGIDVLAYPHKQGEVNYFAGLSFGYGQFNYWIRWYSYLPAPHHNYLKYSQEYYSVMIKNGVRLKPTKHLDIFLNLGIGITNIDYKSQSFSYEPYSSSDVSRAFEGSIALGYTF